MGDLVAGSGKVDGDVTTGGRREGRKEERKEADLKCGELPPV